MLYTRMAKRSTDAHLAVAYLRVSTDEQSLSPDAQRASIEAWAAREGVAITSWHLDQGVSGGTPIDERTGLCEALASMQAHKAGVLVVAKRDRLARDVMVSAMLEAQMDRAGARIVSTAGEGTDDDDPASRLMRHMVDAFAEYERAMIRARTVAALSVKKARGERVGTIPYGYELSADGTCLAPNASEQATIARICELRREGGTLSLITQTLSAESRYSRTGNPLGMTQVARILAANNSVSRPPQAAT